MKPKWYCVYRTFLKPDGTEGKSVMCFREYATARNFVDCPEAGGKYKFSTRKKIPGSVAKAFKKGRHICMHKGISFNDGDQVMRAVEAAAREAMMKKLRSILKKKN